MDQIDTNSLFATYPHIKNRIVHTWGSLECRQYLTSLIMNDHDRKREGFPFEHAKTILALQAKHDELYPELMPQVIAEMPFTAVIPKPKVELEVREPENRKVAWLVIAILVAGALYHLFHVSV